MKGRDIASASVVWGQEKSYADSQEKGLYSRSGKDASCAKAQGIRGKWYDRKWLDEASSQILSRELRFL